jgi:hypothetical protein
MSLGDLLTRRCEFVKRTLLIDRSTEQFGKLHLLCPPLLKAALLFLEHQRRQQKHAGRHYYQYSNKYLLYRRPRGLRR